MPTRFIDVLGRTLDARPDRLDLRDREFTPQSTAGHRVFGLNRPQVSRTSIEL
jgi:hypothetical protein